MLSISSKISVLRLQFDRQSLPERSLGPMTFVASWHRTVPRGTTVVSEHIGRRLAWCESVLVMKESESSHKEDPPMSVMAADLLLY